MNKFLKNMIISSSVYVIFSYGAIAYEKHQCTRKEYLLPQYNEACNHELDKERSLKDATQKMKDKLNEYCKNIHDSYTQMSESGKKELDEYYANLNAAYAKLSKDEKKLLYKISKQRRKYYKENSKTKDSEK
jgi:hypothetical protein